MTELSDLERLHQREYRYAVTRSGNNFIVVIEELSLIATGSSLDECVAAIDQEKEALFKTFVELKSVDSLPMPGSASSTISLGESSHSFKQSLMLTAMSVIIVCIGLELFGLIVAKQIAHKNIYATISNVTARMANEILENLGSEEGPAWKRGMENLRGAKGRYQEVMGILEEKNAAEPE
jgi:hypothetical protein